MCPLQLDSMIRHQRNHRDWSLLDLEGWIRSSWKEHRTGDWYRKPSQRTRIQWCYRMFSTKVSRDQDWSSNHTFSFLSIELLMCKEILLLKPSSSRQMVVPCSNRKIPSRFSGILHQEHHRNKDLCLQQRLLGSLKHPCEFRWWLQHHKSLSQFLTEWIQLELLAGWSHGRRHNHLHPRFHSQQSYNLLP